jgi:hypothetical protein
VFWKSISTLFLSIGLLFASTIQADDFNPTGFYYIHGQAPKTFMEFSYFSINTYDKPQATGWLATVRDERFKYEMVEVTKDNFSFSTATVNGIRYSFKGRFLKSGKFADQTRIDLALEGQLIKFQNNKKVAESFLKFDYFVGD